MKKTTLFPAIASAAALLTGSVHAAVINITDYSVTPDGTNFGSNNGFNNFEDQRTDINTPSGGTIVKSTDPVAYFVTTFSFGAGTSAQINLNFTASVGQERLGVQVNANGTFTSTGDATGGTDFDLGGSLAGQTVTIIGKFEFDATNSDTYGSGNASDDTIATFWVNPTGADTEGSGAPDGYSVTGPGVANANFTGDFASETWNSSQFHLLRQRINNNSTLAGNGDSAIINTTVLTGSDATFANALALATAPIPEPSSTALLGLGGIALILRRRR